MESPVVYAAGDFFFILKNIETTRVTGIKTFILVFSQCSPWLIDDLWIQLTEKY